MDMFNKFFVAVRGDAIDIMNPPSGPISKDDALLLAAWLVVLADRTEERFTAIITAVKMMS